MIPRFQLEATLKLPTELMADIAARQGRHFFTSEKGSSEECERRYGANWSLVNDGPVLCLFMQSDNLKAITMVDGDWADFCARTIQGIKGNWVLGRAFGRGNLEQIKARLKDAEMTSWKVSEVKNERD